MKVIITLPEQKKGGPYISHSRIMNSSLSHYVFFKPWMIPRITGTLKLKYCFSLRRFINEFEPDIIHTSGLMLNGFLNVLIFRVVAPKVPIILAIRGSSLELTNVHGIKRHLFRLLEIWTLNHVNLSYGVSNYVSEWEIVRNSRGKYFGHIYNIPQTPKCRFDRDLLRRKLGFSDNQIVIISTGRITSEKGFDVFSQVVNGSKMMEDVRFIVVGDGEYLNTLKKSIDDPARVLFTGHVDDVEPFLTISDIFLICTKHETLCNSIIEAGQFKLPVIANNVGGIPEIIGNRRGFLISENKVDGYIDAINTLLDSGMRAEYGNRLYEYIQTEFSEIRNMSLLYNAYKQVVQSDI